MILANYLSSWAGFWGFTALFERWHPEVYPVRWAGWCLLLAAYVATLVLEWPFVALCCRRLEHWFRTSVKASLLVQTGSYLVLFGGFYLLSLSWLFAGWSMVRPAELELPRNVILFYISTDGRHVYAVRLDEQPGVRIADLDELDPLQDHLGLVPSEGHTNDWDLAVVRRQDPVQRVWPRVSSVEKVSPQMAQRTSYYWRWGLKPFEAGPEGGSPWKVHWSMWPEVGLWARRGDQMVAVRVMTPFGGYSVWQAVQLPGDLVLVQFEDQVCAVDLSRRRMALLCRGMGILALHDDQVVNMPPGLR
jgi:hypothetical protein